MTTETQPKPPAIPQRADIEEQYTWKLTDIYESDQAWEKDYTRAEQIAGTAEGFKGRLAESAAVLWECLEARSALQQTLSSLYQYAFLNKDLDNRVSHFQAMTERVAMLGSRAGAAFSFVEPELLAIEEAKLRALAAAFPRTDVYDFYIDELIRSKPHVRSGEVEEVLAMSSVIARAPDNIFSMLDDADLTYPSIIDENGNEVKLTKQRYARFLDSKDRRVRRDANEAFYKTYREHINTAGGLLAASVNQDVFYSRVRRYQSCLHNALDGNNIPVSVYHSLLDTTENNIHALHAYTRLRQRLLNLPEIYPYDMLCPLFPDHDYEVPYEKAVADLLKSIEPLGQKYREVLTGAMQSRWVDVYETEGKGGGAYSYGANYNCHPFVLMNYNNTVDSFFTLAHEMGHAMHSYLANSTQPYAKAQYSIFVAEVASTLNEGLLLHYLLKNTTDTGMKLYLLDKQLNGTMGTFFHQVMYARFELKIHEHVESGGALSPDFMTELWGKLTQKYYGTDLTMDEDTPYKWARIPHFYRMFYVYQYATSYAASAAILKKFLDGEPGIVERYLKMLAAGGSNHPIELLKMCGVDMTTENPVLATIELFHAQVREMDALTS